MRVGFGYDIHRFAFGRRLILGGVEFDYDRGLMGHSDADVLCHAIADAILGAAALGDIGVHFPPSDPQFEGISSVVLLERVASLVREAGFLVGNIDTTIVCEQPKVMGRAREMRAGVAAALGVGVESVSVKATTSEGLGSIGAGEGICAHAVATLLPASPDSRIDSA